ncbi:hypothetical protein SFRURICE_002047 [Spodoptera frugiperda]|nr:hypothetical protein SFRURICE_002047 [Spodoptera frugiperda]
MSTKDIKVSAVAVMPWTCGVRRAYSLHNRGCTLADGARSGAVINTVPALERGRPSPAGRGGRAARVPFIAIICGTLGRAAR